VARGANRAHGLIAQLGLRIPLAGYRGALCGVLLLRDPGEIGDAIIRLVAVEVAAFMSIGRRSDEGEEDEAMH
jgi:hypothetical protein